MRHDFLEGLIWISVVMSCCQGVKSLLDYFIQLMVDYMLFTNHYPCSFTIWCGSLVNLVNPWISLELVPVSSAVTICFCNLYLKSELIASLICIYPAGIIHIDWSPHVYESFFPEQHMRCYYYYYYYLQCC